MTGAKLGFNMFIKPDGNGRYVITLGTSISLDNRLVALIKAAVCRERPVIEEEGLRLYGGM